MYRVILIFLITILIIIPVGFYVYKNQTKPTTIISTPTPKIDVNKNVPRVSTVTENLEVPWALAFLPDGSMLVTERPGRVRLIDKEGTLKTRAFAELLDVKPIGEGGLLGIAIHPDFINNHFVYLYYTYGGDGEQTLNRVTRFKFDGETLTQQAIILDDIPGAPNHNGGRLKFGPDNFLYITTGDAQNPSLAQDRNSLAGKILRVTDDGKIAPDNPFNNPIYSYGHRNAQGLTWDSNGKLWATEHGRSGVASGLDELNLIEKGKNYGWPEIQGDQTRRDMVAPKINSGPFTTWAPSGAAFIDNSIFFAGLRGQTLYEAVIENDRVTKIKEHFKGEFGRIREVVVGPDNMLYISTSNRDGRGNPVPTDDKIIRVNPKKL